MSSLVVPSVEEIEAMSPAERERTLFLLDRERRQIEAAIVQYVQRVEACGGHLDDGHRTVKAWGRAACNWSGSEAWRFARAARMFERLPTAAEAAARGELGVAQLHELAAVAANPRVRDDLTDGEAALVGQAKVLDFDDYVTFLRQWETAADPDGAYKDHDRAHQERRAHLSIFGHQFRLDAQGGSTTGAVLKEIFDAYCHTEFLTDWEHGVAEHGDAMTPSLLARTAAQRGFDALQAIFLAATGSRADGEAGPQVVVNVVVGLETFEHHLTRSLGGHPNPVDPTDGRQRCETIDGHTLDPRDVFIAAAMGHVRRVVLDSAGVIIDHGRKQRLFTGPLRDAVLLLARRCTHPGCDRPASKCHADHLLPYSNDGPTAIWNSGPVCEHHNTWKGNGSTTRRDQHGQWHHYRPDGTEIGWRAYSATP